VRYYVGNTLVNTDNNPRQITLTDATSNGGASAASGGGE
jgi:hypothetical protein